LGNIYIVITRKINDYSKYLILEIILIYIISHITIKNILLLLLIL
jgi:hypothetical protein